MKIFTTRNDLFQWRDQQKEAKSLGFVPTMGALHSGHLALVEKALQENDLVICSIFVNPLQFNNPQDLIKYPRDLHKDLELLEATGAHAVFCPDEKEMYPQIPQKVYDFGVLDKVLEGQFRPGHFNGVAIVVKELFEIVQPHKAYFGQKDFQQLQIIRQLVLQENLPVEIIPCPTIREDDGLAMSSRNQRLLPEERQLAPIIYQTLKGAKNQYPQKSVAEIKQWVKEQFMKIPQMNVEYFEIVSADTLLPVNVFSEDQKVLACIAVNLGNVRLIDNLFFN